MSIAAVLKARKDLNSKEIVNAAMYAERIDVGKDFFIMDIPTKNGVYFLVKAANTEYPLSLIKLISKRVKEIKQTQNNKKYITDVEGSSDDMRKFLVKLGFTQDNDRYTLEV
jgi:hypothetical protein